MVFNRAERDPSGEYYPFLSKYLRHRERKPQAQDDPVSGQAGKRAHRL